MRYQLRPDTNLGRELTRQLQSLQEDMALALLMACRAPEQGVHRARKDAKEIRALLRLLQPRLGRNKVRRVQGFFKKIAGQLSGQRDALVMQQTWQHLQQQSPALQSARYQPVNDLLAAEYRRWASADQGEQLYLRLALQVEAQSLAVNPWSLPAKRHALLNDVERIYRKARQARAVAAASEEPALFHEFRKRCKDLFYSLRLMQPLYGQRLKKRVKAFKALTECQGKANDVAVLHGFLCAGKNGLKGRLSKWAALERALLEQQQSLQAESHTLAEPLLAKKPKAFVRSACFTRPEG